MTNNTDRRDIRHLPDWFWQTIDQAKGSADELRNSLEQMTGEQLRQFDALFQEAIEELCQKPYIYYMGSGSPSEDAQEMYASVAVSQGSQFYLNVLDHPELLSQMQDSWHDFYGIAGGVYTRRFGYGIGEEEDEST